MSDQPQIGVADGLEPSLQTRKLRFSLASGLAIVLVALLAALLLPRGLALTALGDGLQTALTAVAAFLALQNARKTHSRLRIFWLLIFAGTLAWTASSSIWAVQEVWLSHAIPDVPAIDILLFLKIVPLCAASLIAPDSDQNSRFRTFGLLDAAILSVYSFYLFLFGVYAFRLLPGAGDLYNFWFNVADSIGNLLIVLCAAVALRLASSGV